jgi:hypothetical protein
MIMEVTFPDYQTAMASLPEEPSPFTLPALQGRFFQPYDMDMEGAADPPADPTAIEGITDPLPMHTTGDTPLPEPQLEPLLPTDAEERHAALTAFLTSPRLRDAARIQPGDISLLIHFLLNTPGRLIALSRTTPSIPSSEATEIWEAWSSHLEHEGTPAPRDSLARDFFTNIIIISPTNAGEHAEVANLLRLYVTDTIKESTLRAHTMGAIQGEPMPQSSSKRRRDEASDTEDTNTYLGHPQTGTPAMEDPLP